MFENFNIPEDVEEEEKSEVKKRIQLEKVKLFVYKEAESKSNIKKIYGILWVKCTMHLQVTFNHCIQKECSLALESIEKGDISIHQYM